VISGRWKRDQFPMRAKQKEITLRPLFRYRASVFTYCPFLRILSSAAGPRPKATAAPRGATSGTTLFAHLVSPRSGEFVQTHVRGRVRPPYLSENPRVFMQLHLRSRDVEFAAEITNEGVRSEPVCACVRLCAHSTEPIELRSYVCIRRMRDRVHVRVFARLCVFRFAIRMYSLPRPLPSLLAASIRLRSVSMSYRQSNLYAGLFRETWRIEGGFHPLSSSTWPLLLSDPFFYVPASIAAKSRWLDRESIPRQHTSTAYLDSIELVLLKHGRSSRFFPPQPIRSTRDSFSLLPRFNKISGFILENAPVMQSAVHEISFFFPAPP